MKYSRGGFLPKHLVVVAVVFIKTAALGLHSKADFIDFGIKHLHWL